MHVSLLPMLLAKLVLCVLSLLSVPCAYLLSSLITLEARYCMPKTLRIPVMLAPIGTMHFSLDIISSRVECCSVSIAIGYLPYAST
jgi:hypothetical protein